MGTFEQREINKMGSENVRTFWPESLHLDVFSYKFPLFIIIISLNFSGILRCFALHRATLRSYDWRPNGPYRLKVMHALPDMTVKPRSYCTISCHLIWSELSWTADPAVHFSSDEMRWDEILRLELRWFDLLRTCYGLDQQARNYF